MRPLLSDRSHEYGFSLPLLSDGIASCFARKILVGEIARNAQQNNKRMATKRTVPAKQVKQEAGDKPCPNCKAKPFVSGEG